MKYHVTITWNGKTVCEADCTLTIAYDMLQMIADNFIDAKMPTLHKVYLEEAITWMHGNESSHATFIMEKRK